MDILYIILLLVGLLVASVGMVWIISHISHKRKGLSPESAFVKKCLPNVDCGMCGEKNCSALAKKIVKLEKKPEACKLIKPEDVVKIKNYIKPVYEAKTQLVAIVKCKGGTRANNKYIYRGADSCAVQEALHSGCKECKFACLGCGDCVKACRFKAIKINDVGTAEIIRSKCTGCGACLSVCPNNLIKRQSVALSVQVICNNQVTEAGTTNKCSVGCTHCENCIKVCPVDAVKMVNNVPVIDESKCIECYKCVTVCPNHVISRL